MRLDARYATLKLLMFFTWKKHYLEKLYSKY